MLPSKIPYSIIFHLLSQGKNYEEIIKHFPVLQKKDLLSAFEYAARILEEREKSEISPSGLMVFIDGASRGNPGPAGLGMVITDEKGRVLKEEKKYLGLATNNIAEYQALVFCLEELQHWSVEKVVIHSDSELLVNQMGGNFRVKDRQLLELFQQARGLIKNLKNIEIKYIPREKNKRADRLANLGINLGPE